MVTGFIAAVAAAAVLLPAVAGFGRSRTYAWIGFVGIIAGATMLIATPTPNGFDPNSASHRWLITAGGGQEIGAGLIAAGVAGLVAAFAAGRPEAIDTEEA